MTGVLVAVSGAPVSPDAFPPGPVPMPPLNVDHPDEGQVSLLYWKKIHTQYLCLLPDGNFENWLTKEVGSQANVATDL